LLDIGGGTGKLTIRNAREVYVIDVDYHVLARGKKQGFRMHALDSDKDHFSFPDNYFDIVTLIDYRAFTRS